SSGVRGEAERLSCPLSTADRAGCIALRGEQCTLQHGCTGPDVVSPSYQPRFRQIEVALNSAQSVIINHALISQTDDGFAFHSQRLVLQALILRCGDFAPAFVGIVRAMFQLLDALVVFRAQTIYRVGRKVGLCARFSDPFERSLVCFQPRQALLSIGLSIAWDAQFPNQQWERQTL